MSALLEIEQLRVEMHSRRGVVVPVDNVSLSIAPGEVVGLAGESGAGKSMLGSAIIGLLPRGGRIAGGRIMLEGVRIDWLAGEALRRLRGRRIGAIFQDPMTALDPLQSVGAQLVETMRTHRPLGEAAARAEALRWLERVGIGAAAQRAEQFPHQFSGGMRQRVVIALALCAEPALVIADEPTTALDVSVQAQIVAVLLDLVRERGTSVLLITHDIGVIAEAADRMAVMYAGRIAETGDVARMIGGAAHPYARALVGCMPRLEHRARRLEQIEGAMPRLGGVPPGCAFAPRCGCAESRCVTMRPAMSDRADGVLACWNPHDG